MPDKEPISSKNEAEPYTEPYEDAGASQTVDAYMYAPREEWPAEVLELERRLTQSPRRDRTGDQNPPEVATNVTESSGDSRIMDEWMYIPREEWPDYVLEAEKRLTQQRESSDTSK